MTISSRPLSGLKWTEWILPLVLATWIVSRCVVLSNKRLFWLDELFTWYPSTAAFGSMLSSTTDTINAAPPLYFIATWSWASVFGSSALALRLFSAIAVAVALLVMFVVLRKTYGPLAASLALAISFGNGRLLSQSVEARFHAPFFAEVAVGILLYQLITERDRPSFWLLLANALTHACMMMTHYFSPLFSGIILVATFFSLRSQNRQPMRACLSIMLGWLVFIPWIPSFLRHSAMGQHGSWIPTPALSALTEFYKSYLGSHFALWGLGLVAFAALGKGLGWIFGHRLYPRSTSGPLIALAVALIATPLLVFIISQRSGGPSVFVSRYMLASILGWSILSAHIIHIAFQLNHPMNRHGVTAVMTILQCAAVCGYIVYMTNGNLQRAIKAKPGAAVPNLAAGIPRGEPIVTQDIHAFITAHFYSTQRARFRFITDLDVGLREGSGGHARHQIMIALKRQFPDQFREVLSTDEFLSTASSFWLRRRGSLWERMRLKNNRSFLIEYRGASLVYVHRIRPTTALRPAAPLSDAIPIDDGYSLGKMARQSVN